MEECDELSVGCVAHNVVGRQYCLDGCVFDLSWVERKLPHASGAIARAGPDDGVIAIVGNGDAVTTKGDGEVLVAKRREPEQGL